jgi:adenylylsulfate kinase-like enzyme
MVIWIIGKSGSGKSYLAKFLTDYYKKKFNKVLWIDGDKFRKKYSKDLGYTIKDRKINSLRIQKHCKVKEELGNLVICSILSMFKDHQKNNRKIFNKYIQIFIDVNINILKKRNNKKVYSKKKNVVGKDIKFPRPYRSNIIIKNKFDNNFLINSIKIIKKINDKL